MAITRVTQQMLTMRAYDGLQTGLNRLARAQEQLSTGKVLNRPSDSPTDTTTAMRLRASLDQELQHARNISDGAGWLAQTDSALNTVSTQVRRARELALTGANQGSMGPEANKALAAEVRQIREGLIALGNTSYLGRPVFGGVTGGAVAFNPDGTYAGTPGQVNRTVSEGAVVRVDTDGQVAFGAGGDSVFRHLDDLAAALEGSDPAGIQLAINRLQVDGDRVISALADVGARTGRVDRAREAAIDAEITVRARLSEVEDVDLAKAVVEVKLQEVAYQAALAGTARVIQPSLLDFLR